MEAPATPQKRRRSSKNSQETNGEKTKPKQVKKKKTMVDPSEDNRKVRPGRKKKVDTIQVINTPWDPYVEQLLKEHTVRAPIAPSSQTLAFNSAVVAKQLDQDHRCLDSLATIFQDQLTRLHVEEAAIRRKAKEDFGIHFSISQAEVEVMLSRIFGLETEKAPSLPAEIIAKSVDEVREMLDDQTREQLLEAESKPKPEEEEKEMEIVEESADNRPMPPPAFPKDMHIDEDDDDEVVDDDEATNEMRNILNKNGLEASYDDFDEGDE
ncbi:hypothetical protein PROFUN_00341 [Planoprotostelium fungivorum]|uniref:Uncharacterized protein n=1 Tax=Planoprotostelium fungivorum TaxID=1890364 RepID=A0A2P6NY33_9EUKA|nr:hypothetical protein PROFUN_00341 [Planoprotostelium fungivorum]